MTVYVAHENVLPGARVINASTGETIKGVVRIDTDGCTVEALITRCAWLVMRW